ncbi:two-component sensor histidine kinase [Thalassotalea sp. M1531]|uniref:histidine kinase n=1 Tax=Thalassotalea algicola TaxID=2716224 RepID=A0A7Y0LBB1_9GAMM|nr:ATP-binding protein [Thalassotalea algicola]NMP31177.1 two-component sensor histidine kinase [Thalassotalea algicola]
MRTLPASLVIVILVATIGLGWLFDNIYQAYIGEELESRQVLTDIEVIGQSIARNIDGQPYQQGFVSNWSSQQGIHLSQLAMADLSLPINLQSSLASGQPLLLESASGVSYHFYLPISEQVLILKHANNIQKQVESTSGYWFTGMFYFILLLLTLAWVMPLINRLVVLRSSTKRLGKGDLTERVKPGGFSYIKDIEIEFNRMAERIESLVADMKLLTSAVSHDLRTPLARIRFGVDTLAEEDDAQLQKNYIERIGNDVDEMTNLVEVLLQYARLEQNLEELEKQPVDLNKTVETCLKRRSNEKANIAFESQPKPIVVNGNEPFLLMLINNVVQNAVKYGSGDVLISAKQSEQKIQLCIEDNGLGISPQEAKQIFKPFIRGQQQSNSKGYGIGLAAVKRIADWHGASISVESSEHLGGAKFVLSFSV